ncbi:MAG: NUDIX domain-containing protein [Candidatus Aenigmatarchaeota archaeon]
MREDDRREMEVHVAVRCYRKTPSGYEVLCARRSPDRALLPGLWECGGGQVYPGESFIEAAKRQLREELGVEIEVLDGLSPYEIPAPGLPQKKIPGVVLVARHLSGEPRVDGRELVEWRWQPVERVGELNFIPGLAENIRKGLEVFKRSEHI